MFKKRTQKELPRRRTPQIKAPSNKVFSYHSVKGPTEIEDVERKSARHNRSQAATKKNRHITLRRVSAGIVFVLVVIGLLYNARLNPNEIHITLRGTPEQRLLLREPSVYKSGASEIMRGNIKNRTKLTFNGTSFSKAMVKQYPEIAHVNVSLPLVGSTPTVYIEPSSAALLFVSQDKKSYIVDTSGRVIADSTGHSLAGMPIVTDQSGVAVKMGAQVLPSNDVRSIQSIVGQLKEKGLPVESLVLPPAAQRLEVRVQGRPYFIKFNLHDTVLQQIGAYIAVQRKLDREGTIPKEYIDVRVADRVYYR